MNHSTALCFLLFVITLLPLNVFAQDTLQVSALKPFGRHLFTDGKHIELIGSASHFGFRFTGKTCQIFAYITYAEGHNYLQYELDGVYKSRIRVNGSDKQPIVISAPNDGEHTVWIYKATEAHTGPIFIEKITGRAVQPLARAQAPLIEFIGNSITCGAASDPSEVACGTGQYHDQHNAFYAYGPRVARALNTNYFLSSVSGIGIYRNWNSDGPTMPQVFESADLQENSKRMWDFKSHTPNIVSIALGTNDFSRGDGKRTRLPFDSAIFVNNYVQFVKLVKSKYPKAQIVLLSSPMVGGRTLENCITAVKHTINKTFAKDKPVATYFFKPMRPHGCSWHPSVEDHALMAEELIPFFKGML
jgi:lysophospholipase L1-like esterase